MRVRATTTPFLSALLFALGVCSSPSAEASESQAWMVRGDEVAVLVTEIDTLRGFDRVTVHVHTVSEAGLGDLVRAYPLLEESQHALWLRKGAYELHRQDLRTAFHAHEERLRSAGWEDLSPLPLSGESLLVGANELHLAWIREEGRTRLDLTFGDRRTSLAQAPDAIVEHSHARRTLRQLDRVETLAISADQRWLFVSVRHSDARDAMTSPKVTVTAIPWSRVLQDLALPVGNDPSS